MKKIVRLSLFALAIIGLVIIYKKPTTVKADNPLVFTFSVPNDVDVTIKASNDRNTGLSNNTEGTALLGFVGDAHYSIDPVDNHGTGLSNENYSVICNDDKHCTVTINNYDAVRFSTSGGTPYILKIGNHEYNGAGEDSLLNHNENFEISIKEDVLKPFDGDAYLVWKCSNGGVCMHEITNIGNANKEENVASEMKYYQVSNMVDTRTGEVFDEFENEDNRGFVYSSNMEEWIRVYKEVNNVASVDWNNVDIEYLFMGDIPDLEQELIDNGTCSDEDEDELHSCVDEHATILNVGIKVQPLGEPNSENSYVSYGDRSFRATIYKSGYRGISLGNLDNLTYIPHYNLDPNLRIDATDISNSSKKNPSFLNTSLLERTLTLRSNEINGFEIKSIKALDVPSEGVIVSKNNEDYVISFMSHYYDDVILEITDTDNNKYYLEVSRTSYDGGIKRQWQPGGGGKASVYVLFYFPSNTSYTDYILTAKYVYKNGTTKTVELENTGAIDDGLGNFDFAYETNGGKNLKMSYYEADIDQDYEDTMSGIYFNVRYKGSTNTRYAGTFAGSGLGIHYNIEEELR